MSKKINISPIEYLWEDRRRRMGMPLSFTKYKLSKDRLFFEKGLFSIQSEEVQLYRISDLTLKMSLWQRIFGTGTILVSGSDRTTPTLELRSVKHPREVKELLNEQVEKVKIARGVRIGEIVDNGRPSGVDADGDGIPDEIDPHVDV